MARCAAGAAVGAEQGEGGGADPGPRGGTLSASDQEPAPAAEGRALVPTSLAPPAGAVVALAPAGSVFDRYRRREGLLVNMMGGMVFGAAVGAAALSTMLGGVIWGIGLLGIGFATVGWMSDVFGLFGNDELERRMRERVGITGPGWVFVGLCRAEQNRLGAKLFPPRIETDENVGFLRLDSDRLVLACEGLRQELPRGALRDVRLEPVAEAPVMEWIRIELYDAEESLQAFLLMARQGDTLRAQRLENRALFDAIREWHVRHRLAPLVAAGELPRLLLEPSSEDSGKS